MPICKRDGFDNAKSKKDETFHDNDEVFYCEVTKEIFREYEDYFRHVMAINSTVWQCEATGRENLTYAEALKSERKARKKMEQFKDSLRPAVLLVIDHAKQSSIKTLSAIACKFLRKRYFLNEEVLATSNVSNYQPYKVVEIIPPGKSPASDSIVYDDTSALLYRLKRVSDPQKEITVPFEKMRRQRHECYSESLLMFIKDNVMRVDGILRPKPEAYKKYVTERKITFSKLFIGKMPHYTPSKIKPQINGKKQSTLNKYLVKGDGANGKNGGKAAEQTKKEKEKAEKAERAEAKAKSLREEMERIRKEKQNKLAEIEREKAEKRAKLLEKIEHECNALLTKTDDLERTDQRLLPTYATIKTFIPTKYLGDALMIREFLHSFVGILSGIEVFRNNLSIYEWARAFTSREVAGPLSDIILILLGSIFDLQKEEEEECVVEYLRVREELRRKEPQISMYLASKTHFYSRRHFSFKINELPIDAQTVSEVLRLHLLSSGANVMERTEKWRIMYRNGYSSSEDPGLQLRMRNPHILRALRMYTIYQLPMADILRVLRCLVSQILTYSAPINVIEERMEQMSKARADLRALSTSENRRLASVQAQRKTLTCDYNLQCMDDEIKNDLEKKKQLEEKLNKKIAEIMAQSERDHKKYEQQVEKFNSSLFDFMVYLGMDRAYRKYYVFESVPGIFVEHPLDCMDTCLNEPPKNALNEKLMNNSSNYPKNRKDLRAYLLKMYTDEAKKAAANEKAAATEKALATEKAAAGEKAATTEKVADTVNKDSQENKENQVIVNGTASEVVTNGIDKEVVQNSIPTPPSPPSQYQLYMCTGDPKNCIVHDERNRDRQRWAYLYEQADIDALIEALNPLGERESQLREQLIVLRLLLLNHVKNCPNHILSMEDSRQVQRFKNVMMADTHRKYSKSNFGFAENANLDEVMYSSLVERILQFESDIYTGDLGRLKVKNMEKWRIDIQNNEYDPQGKLQWGHTNQKLSAAATAAGEDEDTGAHNDDDDDADYDVAKDSGGGKFSNTPFVDPGASLGDTIDIDSEDSDDEEVSLHDSPTLRRCVKNLASALLQVEQAIERRFINEPFGVPLKDTKDKELLERKLKWGADRLKQWEVSLMECTSYSQVFLHLNILHDTIMWARSTNKSCCQVCRRGSEPDKMLLCDECNGGTHMFCMKPKMRKVPEGNWYCNRCVIRLGLKNETEDSKKKTTKRKRTFIVDEDDNKSETSISSVSASVSKNNGKRGGGRRSNKRLRSNEIEETLLQEDEEITEKQGGDRAENSEDENDMEVVEDEEIAEAEAEEAEEEQGETENNSQTNPAVEESSSEEEEIVCIVCSYDGGDVTCTRCRDSFHLECIDLKRPPRHNFVCNKCKGKEDKKRRSNADDDSFDEEDYETLLPSKRSRQSRTQLRNSLTNGNASDDVSKSINNNNSRRSNRRTGEDLPLNSAILYDLLDDVMKHENAWPFLRPVLQSEVPDYYKIIKSPMDFAKIKSKLNMGAYQLNEEVLKDIQLIFRNCDTYNVEGNEIYQAGFALEKFVIDRCSELNLPFQPSDMNG